MNKFNCNLSIRTNDVFLVALLFLVSFVGANAQSVTLTTPATSMTLKTQQEGVINVTVTPVNGFSGDVPITCGSLPQYASCVLPNLGAPAQVSGGAVTLPLTINTSEIYAYNNASVTAPGISRPIGLAVLLWPAAFLFLAFKKKNQKLIGRIVLFLVVLYPMIGLMGCQNTLPHSVTPGTYVIQIQGGIPTAVSIPFTLIVTS